MGLFRFLVHPPERLSDDVIQRSYLTGHDCVPWKSRARRTLDGFVIEREVDDSGNLHILWPVAGHGELTLGTATLMERERPYHLEVELARGKINQLRNQIHDWTQMGLSLPGEVRQALKRTIEQFSHAAISQHEPERAARLAEASLASALDVVNDLAGCFIDQALFARRRQSGRLNTLLGVNLGHEEISADVASRLPRTFNAAVVPLNWRIVEAREGAYDYSAYDQQVDWCLANQMKLFAGPLLQLDRRGLPDWLCLWEEDFENLDSVISDYVSKTVERYADRVRVWICASRVHAYDALSLSEEERLRLIVQTIEITRQKARNAPVVVSFDQPWGEFMSQNDLDLSPLHLADALVRAGLGVSGLSLEMNLGYLPRGTAPRDALEFSRLIDRWSMLGLPLLLNLTCPSGTEPDPLARIPVTSFPPGTSQAWSEEAQQQWIEHYLPLLIAKPAVQGIIWNQLADAHPHDYPHGGLFDASGRKKAALGALTRIRKGHLA